MIVVFHDCDSYRIFQILDPAEMEMFRKCHNRFINVDTWPEEKELSDWLFDADWRYRRDGKVTDNSPLTFNTDSTTEVVITGMF